MSTPRPRPCSPYTPARHTRTCTHLRRMDAAACMWGAKEEADAAAARMDASALAHHAPDRLPTRRQGMCRAEGSWQTRHLCGGVIIQRGKQGGWSEAKKVRGHVG